MLPQQFLIDHPVPGAVFVRQHFAPLDSLEQFEVFGTGLAMVERQMRYLNRRPFVQTVHPLSDLLPRQCRGVVSQQNVRNDDGKRNQH